MRTTLTIEDGIARRLKDIAHRARRSFKAVVNDALRAGLQGDRITASARTYCVEPVALGGVVGQHDLDQALRIADQLEDQELVRRVQLAQLAGQNLDAY